MLAVLGVCVDTAADPGLGLVFPAAWAYWPSPPAHVWLRHGEDAFPRQLPGEAADVCHREPGSSPQCEAPLPHTVTVTAATIKGHQRKDPALPTNAQRTLPPPLDSGAAILDRTGCHLPSRPTGRTTGRALLQNIPQEMNPPFQLCGSHWSEPCFTERNGIPEHRSWRFPQKPSLTIFSFHSREETERGCRGRPGVVWRPVEEPHLNPRPETASSPSPTGRGGHRAWPAGVEPPPCCSPVM